MGMMTMARAESFILVDVAAMSVSKILLKSSSERADLLDGLVVEMFNCAVRRSIWFESVCGPRGTYINVPTKCLHSLWMYATRTAKRRPTSCE